MIANAKPVTFILTANRPQADAFYAETLGLTLSVDDGFAAVFDLGGATLRITEVPDHSPSPHPVLGWTVTDIAAEVAALRDRGVEMIIYEGMGQDAHGIWTAPDGKTKVVFFHDPDRNVLSLTEG